MRSYKNKNYEQALIETILKFDELLKNQKINDYLKCFSKRRSQNSNNDLNLRIISKNNMKLIDYNDCENNNEKNIDNIDNNIDKSDNLKMEISNFEKEFNGICEKKKNENEVLSLSLEDKIKLEILENNYNITLNYFNSKSNNNNEKFVKDKSSKSLSTKKIISTSNFKLNKYILILYDLKS